MTVSMTSVAAASPSAGGNQSFTVPGFGSPLACIFVTSMATSGAMVNRNSFSVGFAGQNTTSSTNQWVAAVSSQNAQGTSNTYRRWIEASDEIGFRFVQGSGAVRAECNFNAWVTDGIQVTWGDADSQDTRMCMAILFRDDHSVSDSAVGSFTPNASQSGTTDVTFAAAKGSPDVVFFTMTTDGSDDTTGDDAKIQIGVWISDDDSQGCVSWFDNDAAATMDVQAIVDTNRVGVELQGSGTVSTLDVSAITDGFRCTTQDAASGYGKVGYLAIWYGSGHQHSIVQYDVPTSTGNDSTTGAGFQPDYWVGLESHCAAYDAINTGAGAEAVGIGFSDGGSNDNSIGCSSEDAAATSNCRAVHGARAHSSVSYPLGTETAQTGTLTFDADGFTINWGAAPLGTTGKSLAYCLRDAPADHTIASHVARMTQQQRLRRM